MFLKYIVCLLCAFGLNNLIHAQAPTNDDCSKALSLCPKALTVGSNNNANAEVALSSKTCFIPSNGVWYSFTANNNGDASILISSISALNSNTKIEGAIISFSSDCDLSTALILSCDSSYSNNLNLFASNLVANKKYYVLIDGGDSTSIAPGSFNYKIQDTGTAIIPTASATLTDASCNKSNGVIMVENVKLSSAPYTYELIGGVSQTDSVFSNLASGSYTIIISDANGCSFSQDFSINVLNGISSISISSTNADCALSQKGTVSLSVLPTNINYNYSLDGLPNQTTTTFSNVAAGTHYVTISNSVCDSTVKVVVSLNGGVTSALGVGETIPCGSSIGKISYPNPILPSPPPVGSQYIFKLVGTNQQNTNGTFKNLKAGTYKIQVFNSNSPSCIYTDIVDITQLPGPSIDTLTSVNDICGSGKGEIQIQAIDGVLPYSYSIDGKTFSSKNTLQNLSKGTYTAIVKDANGCTATNSITINETTPGTFTDCSAGDTKTILSGNKAIVEVQAPKGATITWQPNLASQGVTDTTYKLYPMATTDFTMTAVMPNGCVCTSNVIIKVTLPLEIPNTFTPNGDDKNDKFLIRYTEEYRNVEVSIFDRWGTIVHHTTNYTDDTAWDGTSKGDKLPLATYYYIIRFKFPATTNDDNFYYYEGSIALLR